MIRVSIGPVDVASGTLVLPYSGPWILDARCDRDPRLVTGAQVSVTASDGTTLAGEIAAIDTGQNLTGRVRIVVRPVGSGALSKPLTKPRAGYRETVAQTLSTLGSACGVSIQYTGKDLAQRTHSVQTSTISVYRAIAAICSDPLQHLPSGVVRVGPIPLVTSPATWEVEDRSAIQKTIVIGISDKFLIQPGDVLMGQYTVKSVQYQIGDQVRAVCEVM